ncbi:DUF1403 family protein [Shimia sp. R9_1]|uniref:DUF1403 family protein n=1 Tax=Shimia sp. R9_1 TaxID=2821111 RepID=UPI001ADBCF28|nr:DUF1403 family protein [Shimia sp. R9_1]MBO9409390.1 DUF1403 family protein [Shimia sp. R9_1]
MIVAPSSLSLQDLSLDLPPLDQGRAASSLATQSLEDAAFLSGTALSRLNIVLSQAALPQPLLRERLALRAAEACVIATGRPERLAELRDAVLFLRPEDQAGPAGDTYQSWRRAAARPLSAVALHRAFPQYDTAEIETWMTAEGEGASRNPLSSAASTLEAVLRAQPKAEALALALADATLSKKMRWSYQIPLLALSLTPRDLRKTGDALHMACHQAAASGAEQAIGLALGLIRKSEALRAIAPKLRAKGAAQAVDLFLSHDAVAPQALTHLMSDRAARRFCDRLVSLGVARELTGRESFRLYGI